MLEHDLKEQLKTYLANLKQNITVEATLDNSSTSQEMKIFLTETSSLSDKISFNENGSSKYVPSFEIKNGKSGKITFAAIPLGHEFSSFVLALLQAGGHSIKFSDETINSIKNINEEHNFVSYISLSCQNCSDVVQAINAMAVINPKISSLIIDGALFNNEAEKMGIMAVPTVYLNGKEFYSGHMTVEDILGKIGSLDNKKIIENINKKERFDVLVIGGGPAGSTAAIYTARKGINVGMAVEKPGGQVLETSTVENFISVKQIEGVQLALDIQEHVRNYDIDIITPQKVNKISHDEKGYLISCESGAVLKTKAVIIATGARWKRLNVPGEEQYLNKGVAFCPHCDGPLFKNKNIAVIGGGNSGIEGAIDLAGLAKHVTVIEFLEELRADAILQRKLYSMGNVDVIKNAQVTEVFGNGKKVTSIDYVDRKTSEKKNLLLDGIFVQIGLMPNSEWLRDFVDINSRGEIVIDEKCKTSKEGIFAAGDVSSVPYKQIVIAIGEGAKASLSAFDYLIRKE